MKRNGEGSGTGGDWSVRIAAERASDLPALQESEDGVPAAPDRVSLLFYLGDERVRAFEMSTQLLKGVAVQRQGEGFCQGLLCV